MVSAAAATNRRSKVEIDCERLNLCCNEILGFAAYLATAVTVELNECVVRVKYSAKVFRRQQNVANVSLHSIISLKLG